jgi:hypothetical protein
MALSLSPAKTLSYSSVHPAIGPSSSATPELLSEVIVAVYDYQERRLWDPGIPATMPSPSDATPSVNIIHRCQLASEHPATGQALLRIPSPCVSLLRIPSLRDKMALASTATKTLSLLVLRLPCSCVSEVGATTGRQMTLLTLLRYNPSRPTSSTCYHCLLHSPTRASAMFTTCQVVFISNYRCALYPVPIQSLFHYSHPILSRPTVPNIQA